MREMTDDERATEQKRLAVKINTFLGRPMNGRTVERIEEIVKDHRTGCRLRGIDFPECAVVIMPTAGNIEIVPRDLDLKGVQTLIVNIAKKWPTVSAADLSFGIHRAFPGYSKQIGAAEQAKGFKFA